MCLAVGLVVGGGVVVGVGCIGVGLLWCIR